MIGAFWNVRGLNGLGRASRVKELIREHHPDFICISETKKTDFFVPPLESIDTNSGFVWRWLPAKDTAGGVLVGITEDCFELINCDIHEFSVSCLLKNKCDGFQWRLISVYGPSYDDSKVDFINELHNLLNGWSGPTLIGGDFNLIRVASDKNNGNINQNWANLFMNGLIGLVSLRLRMLGEDSLGLITKTI